MKKFFDSLKNKKIYFLLILFIILVLPYVGTIFKFGFFGGYVVRGISFGLLSFCFFFLSDLKSIFNDRKKSILLLMLFVFSFISFLINLNATRSLLEILSSFATIIANIMVLCIYFDFATQGNLNIKYVRLLINIFVIVSIIYSLAFEIQDYYYLFNKIDHSNYDVTSFFSDKNTFGYFLVFGSLSNLDFSKKNDLVNLLMMLLYFCFSFLARTKTSFVLILIILLTQFVHSLKNKDKKIRYITIITVSLSAVVFAIFVILKIGFFAKIYNFVFEKYGLLYDGRVVIESRFSNWKKIINTIFSTPTKIIFGLGEKNAFSVISVPIDNSFLYLVVTGGLLKLAMFIIFSTLLYKEVEQTKEKMLFFLIVFLYGLMQDYLLFVCNFASVGFLISLCLIIHSSKF